MNDELRKKMEQAISEIEEIAMGSCKLYELVEKVKEIYNLNFPDCNKLLLKAFIDLASSHRFICFNKEIIIDELNRYEHNNRE